MLPGLNECLRKVFSNLFFYLEGEQLITNFQGAWEGV